MMFTALLLTAAPCFQPMDTVPGWKQIALPNELPHLAAPTTVSQFRSGERFTLVEQQVGLYAAGQPNGGTTEFVLNLGKGARSVDLVFQESLRGAKVDVTSWGRSLMHEKRVGSDRLSLDWADADISTVLVRVHHHLREPPVLMERSVLRFVTAEELDLPIAFQQQRSLFYFQETATPVVLCEAPTQPLHMTPSALAVARTREAPRLLSR